MKKSILLLITICLLTVSCSKESAGPQYAESKRITYTFSPGIGETANITIYSNREAKYINTNEKALYSYQDEVRPGDKISLIMKNTGPISGNFEIRVTMDNKMIFSSDKIEEGSIPKSIIIEKVLDKSYFKK